MDFTTLSIKIFSVVSILWFGVFSTAPSVAATIEPFNDPVMGCDIRIAGVIKDGDSERLRDFLEDRRGVLAGYRGPVDDDAVRNICFDSPGGSFIEAIRLARIIKAAGIGTAVGKGSVCESACALAFMAGSQYSRGSTEVRSDRHLHSSARLGFHAPALSIPQGSFNNDDVQKGFNVSLETVSELMNFYGIGAPHYFPYGWFFETPNDGMRFVETIGEALLLGINVVDLPLPKIATVSTLQRACAVHLSISHFHVSGLKADRDWGFVWRSFDDIETLQRLLIPFEQRSNPWELWEQSRSRHERQRSMASRIPSAGPLNSFEMSFAMEDSGGGERGQSFSSCEVRFVADQRDQDRGQNAGVLGYIEYLSNPSLGEAIYGGRLLVGHLHDPWTRLRDVPATRDLQVSLHEWLNLLEQDVDRLMGNDRLIASPQSCWLTAPTARVTNVTEYVNLRRQPNFSAPVIRQVPLGERVRVVDPNTFNTGVGTQRERDACGRSCQAFSRNPDDAVARDQAQKCIDDNMIWFEIMDARGNRGWVSRKFLEEVE